MEFDLGKNTITLDSSDAYKNFIKVEEEDCELAYLNNDKFISNKGINSFIFIVKSPSAEIDRAIKIFRQPMPSTQSTRFKQKLDRFEREIKCLRHSKINNLSNVVEIFADGMVEIDNKTFRYFIMEKGDMNLTDYLLQNRLTTQQKFLICSDLLKSLKQLHRLKIYHRDIKSDNILLIDKALKICDLGLARYRSEDMAIDKPNEKIGPAGWLSPESTNKMYTYKKKTEFNYDCDIDFMSDIFQLGKLFWFVFQGNLPLGQINRDDFKCEDEDDDIFNVINTMLQYDKGRRHQLNQIESELKPIRERLVA